MVATTTTREKQRLHQGVRRYSKRRNERKRKATQVNGQPISMGKMIGKVMSTHLREVIDSIEVLCPYSSFFQTRDGEIQRKKEKKNRKPKGKELKGRETRDDGKEEKKRKLLDVLLLKSLEGEERGSRPSYCFFYFRLLLLLNSNSTLVVEREFNSLLWKSILFFSPPLSSVH